MPVSIVSICRHSIFPIEVWWRLFIYKCIFCAHYYRAWYLITGVCAGYIQQCVCSSHQTVLLLVDIQHTCPFWFVRGVLFLRLPAFVCFFCFSYSLSTYLGCRHVYVVLEVPTIAWYYVV